MAVTELTDRDKATIGRLEKNLVKERFLILRTCRNQIVTRTENFVQTRATSC